MSMHNTFQPDELDMLIAAVNAGASISDTAALLGRSFSCVQAKRRELIAEGRLEDRRCGCTPALANLIVQLIRDGKSDDEIAAVTGETPLAIEAKRCRVDRSRGYVRKVEMLSNEARPLKRVSWRVENGVDIFVWRPA